MLTWPPCGSQPFPRSSAIVTGRQARAARTSSRDGFPSATGIAGTLLRASASPKGIAPAQIETPPGRVPAGFAFRFCRASAIRLRAQRREVLPNISASLRSEIGLPSWTLAR